MQNWKTGKLENWLGSMGPTRRRGLLTGSSMQNWKTGKLENWLGSMGLRRQAVRKWKHSGAAKGEGRMSRCRCWKGCTRCGGGLSHTASGFSGDLECG